MTGLNYFQGNFEESREATEYEEDEDDAAMRYELGDGDGTTDADGAVTDQIGSVVGHAEWATKTLARQAQLRALDSCHVDEHCHELKNTTRIRQTPNATLDLPYSSHSATETPVNHDGNVTQDASESGCLTQITAYSQNLGKLLRNPSTCTSCNASKAFVPFNMLDKAGRCLDFTPQMKSYCTQLDRVGWTAAIGLRHVLCTKYGLAWTGFAVYKMPPGPAKDHFMGGNRTTERFCRSTPLPPSTTSDVAVWENTCQFRKAQCSLVKYTACRFNSGTNSTACINKKTVKCVTVCHAPNPARGEATTSVANSEGCNATMCEGKYGSLACQQFAMQA